MSYIQKLNNVSFGTKFVLGENYLENDKQRIKKIGKKYERATKGTPNDTFVVNSGYLEYYKKGKSLPLRYQLNEDKEYIKELLKYDDKTILEKFKLLSDIAKKAFKCEEEKNKFLDKIHKMTGDSSIEVINEYDEYGIGETYAFNSINKDNILNNVIDDALFD